MGHSYSIVAGVDGSEGGQRALRWALREAASRGGTVRAVTAWTYDPDEAVVAGYAEQKHQDAEAILSTAISQALNDNPRVTVAAEVVTDQPAHGLVTAARDADLLVLGSHGHGRVFHEIVGSVTGECIRAAVCPVVVVPVPHTDTSGTEPAAELTPASR